MAKQSDLRTARGTIITALELMSFLGTANLETISHNKESMKQWHRKLGRKVYWRKHRKMKGY